MQPVKLVRSGANGRTAFSVYRQHAGSFELEAIQSVTARANAIVTIDHFLMPEVFDVFGLARTI